MTDAATETEGSHTVCEPKNSNSYKKPHYNI